MTPSYGLLTLLALLAVGSTSVNAIQIIQPPPSGSFDFIPDIPLWIRLGQHVPGQCYELYFDGNRIDIICDSDNILSGTVPLPGEHRVELVATFLPSGSGIQASSTFTVTNNFPIPESLSQDGVTIEIPQFIHDYHKWWHTRHVWLETTWMGASAQKQPMDLWTYQEVLYEIKPTVFLEIGTRFGGATLFFDGVMRTLHEDLPASAYRLLSVDIQHTNVVSDKVRQRPNVELLEAPSASLRVQNRVRELRLEFPGPLFTILDADHGMDNVTLELQMVAMVMEEGDYLVVEDTNLDGHEGAVAPGWGPCPYDAVLEFMAMNRGLYERDFLREYKFGFSQSIAGFWKRKGKKGHEIMNPLPENPYLHA